jgi:hypothetical protein
MRLRLVGLAMLGIAMLGIAMLGIAHAALAAEIDPVGLRGSSVPVAALGYPILPARAAYAGPDGWPPSTDATAPGVLRTKAPAPPPSPLAGGFRFELGTRVFISNGSLAKNLSDDPRSSPNLVSRLTYSSLSALSFEGFGRAENAFGTFAKGTVGIGGLGSGTLRDEDFPPALSPYSNTVSLQQEGRLAYGNIDVGQIVATAGRVRGSLFLGYGYLAERVNAFGCSQTAGNPAVCVPAISNGILAITEDTHWNFARLGFLGEVRLFDRLTLLGEVAWVPYAQIDGQDTHWLRLGAAPGSFSGPTAETGAGSGVQIEAILSYQVTDLVSLGLGGRYWYLQTNGVGDLEQAVVGFSGPPASQPLRFTTTRYGVFAQGAFQFGPL